MPFNFTISALFYDEGWVVFELVVLSSIFTQIADFFCSFLNVLLHEGKITFKNVIENVIDGFHTDYGMTCFDAIENVIDILVFCPWNASFRKTLKNVIENVIDGFHTGYDMTSFNAIENVIDALVFRP